MACPSVLDLSGAALTAALQHGGIFLVKPSQSELESYAGHELDDAGIEATARAIIARGQAQMVAVTLGAPTAPCWPRRTSCCACRPWRSGCARPWAPATASSARRLGALSEGWEIEQAFLLGMAAGAAATANPGTSLCRKEDVFGLFEKAGGKTPAARA